MTERRSAVAVLSDRTSRTFVLEQRIRYQYSGPVTDVRQRLKIIPPTAHGGQRRQHWGLTVDGVEAATTRSELDEFGNLVIDVVIPQVRETVEFVVKVEAETACPALPYETTLDRRHLRPTRLTGGDGILTEMARSTSGRDAAALCETVYRSIDYEWGTTGVRTTASEALAGGRGVCQDYAHIMLSICRALGLPARYVSGHLAGEGGSHAWVEVLQPHPFRRGVWIAEGWDPTHNRRTDADYLVVAVGRDYSDVAPLSGTYDGPGVSNVLAVDKRLSVS